MDTAAQELPLLVGQISIVQAWASPTGSPDAVSNDGRGTAGPADIQQQMQANRIDYNQAEIERRDEEIANIEQTVDGECAKSS